MLLYARRHFKKNQTGHLGLFEEAQEAELLWPQDQEGVASAVDAPGGPAHPVDVLLRRHQTACLRSRSGRLALVLVWGVHRLLGYLGVVRGVVLDDPVHLGDVQSSGGHVRAQQDP